MTTDNFYFYLQNRLIQTSQTGGQWYSDTSPFSIPCLTYKFKTTCEGQTCSAYLVLALVTKERKLSYYLQQDRPKLALKYLQMRKPPQKNLADVQIHVTTYAFFDISILNLLDFSSSAKCWRDYRCKFGQNLVLVRLVHFGINIGKQDKLVCSLRFY